MSERAQKILTLLSTSPSPVFIRQQTIAEEFGCSRRTIGRALKELKNAGLLVDLVKRHANGCKLYMIKRTNPSPDFDKSKSPSPTRGDGLTPQAKRQLELYQPTFENTFRDWPDWKKYYPEVTRTIAVEADIHVYWRQTFDRLYAIRARFLISGVTWKNSMASLSTVPCSHYSLDAAHSAF